MSLGNGRHLTTSKEPEYYANKSVVMTVTALNNGPGYSLILKPTGMISGRVQNSNSA